MCILKSNLCTDYLELQVHILGIKKLHKSEEEGGNRRPGFLLKLPPGLSKLALALLASAASTVQLTSLGIGALLY